MRWKWILGVLACLCAAVILTLYIILLRFDFNDLKPSIITFVRNNTGRELSIAGDMEFHIGLSPTLVFEGITLQNASWSLKPELAKIKRLEIQIALIPLITGEFMIDRLIVMEPDIVIETNMEGRSNLEFKPLKEREKTVPEKDGTSIPQIIFNKIEILRGGLTYSDGRSGRTYSIDLDRIVAGKVKDGDNIDLLLNGIYSEMPFEIKGTVGPLEAILDPGLPLSLDILAETGVLTLSLKGTLSDPLKRREIDLDLQVQGNDLANLREITGGSLPFRGPFMVDCLVSGHTPGKYEISELVASLGENRINGFLEIDLTGRKPEVNGNLSSERLDLKSLFYKAKQKNKYGTEMKLQEKSDRLFSDNPIPVKSLEMINGGIRLGIRELLLPWLVVTNLQMDMDLMDKLLKVQPLKAEMEEGLLDVAFTLDGRDKQPSFDVYIKTTDLELGNVIRGLEYEAIIEGKLDLDLELKGRGDTPASIMAGLNGKVYAVMGDGRIYNKYIELLGSDLSSGIFRLLKPSEEDTDFTQINCFVNRFDIKNGLADISACVMDTPFMTVAGMGQVNLKTEKLDISLDPSPKQGVAGFSMSISELTKPFRLSGTLMNPSLGIDPNKAALALGKAVGGVILFGPAGILAAIAGKSSEAVNPCLAAIEAAEKGYKGQEEKKPKKEENILQQTGETLGGALKKLFGR